MMFQQLLHEQTIKTSLEAGSPEGAFAELTALLPAWVATGRQKSHILELLLQRELFDSTYAGNGLSTPHCFFGNLPYPSCALGISRKGISYSPAGSGQKLVHFVFLTVFPENSVNYPEILAGVQKFFSDPFLSERLKICDSPEEIFEILIRESQFLAVPARTARLRAAR